MKPTKLPSSTYRTFYYPYKLDYEKVWNYLETIVIKNSNSKMKTGTLIRRLIFKYVADQINKKSITERTDQDRDIIIALESIMKYELKKYGAMNAKPKRKDLATNET